MARAGLPAKLLPPHRVVSSQGEIQEPSPGQLGTSVAAPPCPPSTGRPGADTGQHPALYLCPVCAQTRLLSQKGPRGPVKTGLHPLPPGLRRGLTPVTGPPPFLSWRKTALPPWGLCLGSWMRLVCGEFKKPVLFCCLVMGRVSAWMGLEGTLRPQGGVGGSWVAPVLSSKC